VAGVAFLDQHRANDFLEQLDALGRTLSASRRAQQREHDGEQKESKSGPADSRMDMVV
jgi:hypothetical protein